MDTGLPDAVEKVQADVVESGAAFYVLCRKDRQGLYRSRVGSWDRARVLYFQTVEDLLGRCLLYPPLAVIVDIPTQISIGSKHVTYLYELRMAWPVMRCKDMSDGSFNVMCHRPMRNDKLLVTLENIAGGDPTWIGLAGQRRHIRMDLVRRARLRAPGTDWQRVNTLNVSGAGLFLVTYHPPPLGTSVSVEVYDLSPEPITISGTVIRISTWETSDDLPGVAVQVADQSASEHLAKMIASHELTEVFREHG